MQEIQAMGSIYRNAVLTIIAAPQSSADEDQGLLGMRPGNRLVQQDVVKRRECSFAATMPDSSTALCWSRWSCRAWTYQEHLMSKRELIFTPYQAFFSCQQDAWSEDLVDNACVHLTDDDADERPCCVYQTPARCEGNRVEGVPRLVEPDNEVPSYEALIEEYTARRLSYQYDALNGINGLLSLLSLETGVLLLCGLPIPRLLDHYLFWMPRGSTRRRKLFEVPGETFPSWSWTGWEGAVYFPRTLPVGYEQWDEKAYGNRSIVGGAGDYDVYQATGLLWSDVVVFEDLVPTSHRLPFPSPAGEGKTRGKKQVSGQKCQNTWLRFVAFVAAVSVSRQAWGTFMLAVDGSRASACHALFVEGSRAGLVVFHQSDPLPQYDTNTKAKEDAWTASPNTTERCEILALSTDNEPWGLHLPISDDPDDLANSGVWDPQEERMVRYHLPFDECKWPEDGQEIPMVNVIVVERCERMMYRRGVDQMHPEAWWKSAYKEEAVWLG
ncbi:hypothetical protein B0A55_03143 [Friedmanniomyces simplex]|uniref:Heterokaryon incompatibility domain-containing protein n=1 Tax=Friedmanniomyces simplex TaxID=329884 RepID=A0A4U0XK52_9PEZI|nr:hypothetical protein B0A55_03143 [Friedmanniomyces simplex]